MNLKASILCLLSGLIYMVNCINILNEQRQIHSINSIAHPDHKEPHLAAFSPPPPPLPPLSAPPIHHNQLPQHLQRHLSHQQQQQQQQQQPEQDLDNNINHLATPNALPVLQHPPASPPPRSSTISSTATAHLQGHPTNGGLKNHHHYISSNSNHNNLHTSQTQQQKKGNSNWQNQNLNKLTKYLNAGQLKLIEENPGSLMAVARALKMATVECHYQMRNEPWDCPIYGFSTRPTDMFGMLMSRSFKETSFIQSLLSSALAHSITRACTESTISTCQRKQSIHNKSWFIEDTEFGIRFAREFMELAYDKTATSPTQGDISQLLPPPPSPQPGTTGGSNNNNNNNNIDQQQHQYQIQTTTSNNNNNNNYNEQPISREKRLRHLINKHNDEVGRLTIFDSVKRECKCHGLSGACTLQTCWTRLPPFREVANRLHDSLDKALRVTKEIYIPLTGNSSPSSRYKSLTSPTTKKSNKKRSSSSQPLSSIETFGRSTPPSIKSSYDHYGGIGGAGLSGGNGVGVGVGRLQAFHDTMNNAVANTGGNNNPGANGMDGQSLREFIGTNNNNNNMPSSHSISMMSQLSNTTVVKKRPVARSIGITTSVIVPSKSDLLYAEESPDFCMPSESYNIKGTKGRICSENEKDINSCKRLCCDRGYKTEIREEKYKCGCKFKFCCELECNTCTRRKIIHKCL